MSAPPIITPNALDAPQSHTHTRDNFQMAPPGGQYVRTDDLLIFDYISSTAINGMNVLARLMTTSGDIVEYNTAVPMIADSATHTVTIPLNEGFLLSVVVQTRNFGAVTPRGQIYCVVSIGRLTGIGAFLRGFGLISDYLTGLGQLAWPGGILRNPTEGPGFNGAVTLAPAAGNDIVFTNGLRQRARVHGLTGLLTTSAAVANRVVELQILSGANILYRAITNINQAASLAWNYVFTPAFSAVVQLGTTVFVPLPVTLTLPASAVVKTVTPLLQGTDQWSNVVVTPEVWFDV